MKQLSNQPHKGETYYGVRLYNNKDKYIGSHNGIKVTKRVVWFVKDYLDMFIDELNNKAKLNNIKVVIEKKTF